MARITCYDGVGCIGGNKILLEDDWAKLFFDFGKNFGTEGAFYEDFLQPKTCTGFYELAQLGLLPPIHDLYRRDMVTELCDPWSGVATTKIGDVGGVLVSHAHVDHIGALHFLDPDIPIYASAMTGVISRALQDTTPSGIPCEYCYYVGRVDDGGLAKPNYRTHPYIGRKYHLTETPEIAGFGEFWMNCPDSRALEAFDCEPKQTCAGLNVKSFPVDHSVYGATAWAVETSAGWVVYSGDLRLHGKFGHLTRRFAEEAAKLNPAALIIEGTRIANDSSPTEANVLDACVAAAVETRALVVADFGPRNVERLISFLEVARASKRRLAIMPKDAYLLEAMRKAGGPQEIPPLDNGSIAIYCEHQGKSGGGKWREEILDQYPHLRVTPQDVAIDQRDFICCFSFFDINELAYIKPAPGSSYIYSSCEAFNEEMQMSADKLRHWIDFFGLRLYGRLDDTDGGDDPFHVSGHASRSDLMEIVRTIRPKMLIPVHTTHPEVYTEQVGDICDVRLPEKGVGVEL